MNQRRGSKRKPTGTIHFENELRGSFMLFDGFDAMFMRTILILRQYQANKKTIKNVKNSKDIKKTSKDQPKKMLKRCRSA